MEWLQSKLLAELSPVELGSVELDLVIIDLALIFTSLTARTKPNPSASPNSSYLLIGQALMAVTLPYGSLCYQCY
jgi:hypothetical protein